MRPSSVQSRRTDGQASPASESDSASREGREASALARSRSSDILMLSKMQDAAASVKVAAEGGEGADKDRLYEWRSINDTSVAKSIGGYHQERVASKAAAAAMISNASPLSRIRFPKGELQELESLRRQNLTPSSNVASSVLAGTYLHGRHRIKRGPSSQNRG